MKLHEADQIRVVERFALGNLGKVKMRHVGEGKNRPGPGMSFQLFFDPQEFFGAAGSDPGRVDGNEEQFSDRKGIKERVLFEI
jgi:hypothetical protein